MKTTARQFFDIWSECVEALQFSRRYGNANLSKSGVLSITRERHGPQIAIEAECYFERLRADTQAGISSL